MIRNVALLALALGTVGCFNEQSCRDRPNDPLCQNVDSGAGDSAVDAGSDANADAHVPCDGVCSGTTSHCLTTPTELCVACRDDGDCSGTLSRCEPAGNTCVACVGATDCTDPAAAVCGAAHSCGPCTTNPDCAHLTGTGVCDTGTCVECTASDESACGANSCDPATNTCTTTPRASVATCHACVADSECMGTNDRCVPMEFMGAAHGSYCLRDLSAGCTQPLGVPTPARVSASGATAATYCGVLETATTCEAVLDLVANRPCTMPSDCGAASLDDGLCQTVSGTANRCTYACGGSNQCPTGFMCGLGGNYCGSP